MLINVFSHNSSPPFRYLSLVIFLLLLSIRFLYHCLIVSRPLLLLTWCHPQLKEEGCRAKAYLTGR